MKYPALIYLFSLSALAGNAFAQVNCYSNNSLASTEILKKTEVGVQYKGQVGLSHLLSTKIDFLNLVPGQVKKFYTDTAQVRFILSREGKMSDLSISGTNNELFRTNLMQAMKNSACYWKPGHFSGRDVTSWVMLNVFYSIERKPKSVSFEVGYDILSTKVFIPA